MMNTKNKKPVYPAAVFLTGGSGKMYLAVAVRENGRQNGEQRRITDGSAGDQDKTGDSLADIAFVATDMAFSTNRFIIGRTSRCPPSSKKPVRQ